MKRYRIPIILLISQMLISLGCGDDTVYISSPRNNNNNENLSFSADILPLFTATCASAGCHDVTAEAGLNLEPDQAYENMVDVASLIRPTFKHIDPGNVENSYFIVRMENRQFIGEAMPPPPEMLLDSNSIQMVKDWINQGALNN